jgi:hypothetical protein
MTYRGLENNHGLRHRFSTPHFHNHQNPHRRQRQKQTHLNIHARCEQKTAQMPIIALIAEQRREKPQDRKAIVEASQHEDTMHSLRQDE